jgi:hypothetical protein
MTNLWSNAKSNNEVYNMNDYIVTKDKPIEIMTTLFCEIRLFKNLETNRIVGELYVDSSFFGDFCLTERGMACCPDDEDWKMFFEEQFKDWKVKS